MTDGDIVIGRWQWNRASAFTEDNAKLHRTFVLKMLAKAGVKPSPSCTGKLPPQCMPIALDNSFQKPLAKGNYLDTLGPDYPKHWYNQHWTVGQVACFERQSSPPALDTRGASPSNLDLHYYFNSCAWKDSCLLANYNENIKLFIL